MAAAHSACYAMALSSLLTPAGTPPDDLIVSAVCTLDRHDEGYRITTMDLIGRARARPHRGCIQPRGHGCREELPRIAGPAAQRGDPAGRRAGRLAPGRLACGRPADLSP